MLHGILDFLCFPDKKPNFDNKPVESEFFSIFPLEVIKTSFTTNGDHSKNYVQSMRNLQDGGFENHLKRWLVHFNVESHALQEFRF